MAFRGPTERHWRSYGTEPLPTPAEALQQPMRAFPSWFLKVTCERCFKDRMLNESHMTGHQRGIVLRVLLSRMRHDGCGGRAGRAELLTGIEDVSSRPVQGTCYVASRGSTLIRRSALGALALEWAEEANVTQHRH